VVEQLPCSATLWSIRVSQQFDQVDGVRAKRECKLESVGSRKAQIMHQGNAQTNKQETLQCRPMKSSSISEDAVGW